MDDYFDMRQGKAESIQDYIFREEILTVALQKDTASARVDVHAHWPGFLADRGFHEGSHELDHPCQLRFSGVCARVRPRASTHVLCTTRGDGIFLLIVTL